MTKELLTESEVEAGNERTQYPGKPILFDAARAHREGLVTYQEDGSLIIQPELIGESEPKVIPPERQKPGVEVVTMMDVAEPLSRVTRPPVLPEGSPLRIQFEKSIENLRTQLGSVADEVPKAQYPTLPDVFNEEYLLYLALRREDYQRGRFESDYGNYLFDPQTGFIYKISPKHIHRLALVTSNSHILRDSEKTMTWLDVRHVFDNATIAVAGVSVGGSIVEAISRDVRPGRMILGDPDHNAVTNLNRLERATVNDVVGTRAQREDPKNPWENYRPGKAASLARQCHLVDPYEEIHVYDAIDVTNRGEFLRGVDVVFEEVHTMEEKYNLREEARRQRTTLIMMSDFGLMPSAEIADFRRYPNRSLALGIPDKELKEALDRVGGGGPIAFWNFVEKLCGPNFRTGACGEVIVGDKGEQTTGGLAQLGGVAAMTSGGVASYLTAMKLLDYPLPARIEANLENFRYNVKWDSIE